MTMSTQTGISAAEVTYNESAQARIAELRAMRDNIPHLVIPARQGDTRRLKRAALLPPRFVELTVVAMKNSKALVRGTADPDRVRDLVSYADAFEPVTAELEALLVFLRHSVTVARNAAGSEALTTFAVAKRLATRPENAELAPIVKEMALALGEGSRKAKAPAPAAAPSTPAPTPVTAPAK